MPRNRYRFAPPQVIHVHAGLAYFPARIPNRIPPKCRPPSPHLISNRGEKREHQDAI